MAAGCFALGLQHLRLQAELLALGLREEQVAEEGVEAPLRLPPCGPALLGSQCASCVSTKTRSILVTAGRRLRPCRSLPWCD